MLDPEGVPPSLRYLVPLAERWGIGDDYERDAAVEAASDRDREALVAELAAAPDDLWEWLAGEASYAQPTAEYVAFTCLTMASDLARVLLKRDA